MSDKLKPIEAGCLALVVGYKGLLVQNNGKIIKVIDSLEKEYKPNAMRNLHSTLGPCWSIDTALAFHVQSTSEIEYHPIGAEKYLMRIDPDDDQKKAFEKEKRQMDRVRREPANGPVFIPQEIQK